MTPLLTPLRAQHPETAGNHQQRKQLRYADSATYGNTQKHMSADCGSESTEVERIGTRAEQGGQAPPRRLPVYVAEVPAGPSIATPLRPRSRAEVLGGVTAGGAVSSYGVQVILDEGI